MSMDAARRAGAFLTIDLDAAVHNWRFLAAMTAPAPCAAVVKADAYGLGANEVASALQAAGCDTFFVVTVEEGVSLRAALGPGSMIAALGGTPPGASLDLFMGDVTPVINSLTELAEWRALAEETGGKIPVILQLDSGMSRFGLSPAHVQKIAADKALLTGLDVELIISHLACADEPAHPANEAQRLQFERLRRLLPEAPASLANSSGIFLGPSYVFDLGRPGAALYGLNPTPHQTNPMRPVVRVDARVAQLREVPAGSGIGYAHSVIASRPTRLATLSIGYADGWPRASAAGGFFNGHRLPLSGRVSMDSIIVDVTDCPFDIKEGNLVEMIGSHQDADAVAGAIRHHRL
jgi:alanine racemase